MNGASSGRLKVPAMLLWAGHFSNYATSHNCSSLTCTLRLPLHVGNNKAADFVTNCLMVEIATSTPSHNSLKRSHRRLPSETSAKHTDAVVTKAKALVGDDAVVAHQALGPVIPGFSTQAAHDEAANRLMDTLEQIATK